MVVVGNGAGEGDVRKVTEVAGRVVSLALLLG